MKNMGFTICIPGDFIRFPHWRNIGPTGAGLFFWTATAIHPSRYTKTCWSWWRTKTILSLPPTWITAFKKPDLTSTAYFIHRGIMACGSAPSRATTRHMTTEILFVKWWRPKVFRCQRWRSLPSWFPIAPNAAHRWRWTCGQIIPLSKMRDGILQQAVMMILSGVIRIRLFSIWSWEWAWIRRA